MICSPAFVLDEGGQRVIVGMRGRHDSLGAFSFVAKLTFHDKRNALQHGIADFIAGSLWMVAQPICGGRNTLKHGVQILW